MISNFYSSIKQATTDLIINELKKTKEEPRLEHSDEGEESLTDEFSRNELDVDDPEMVDLGTNKESEDLIFDCNNPFKEIINQNILPPQKL